MKSAIISVEIIFLKYIRLTKSWILKLLVDGISRKTSCYFSIMEEEAMQEEVSKQAEKASKVVEKVDKNDLDSKQAETKHQ